MKVLAVDPGYDRLGVAVMEYKNGAEVLIYSSCIETDAGAAQSARLGVIGEAVAALIEEHKPGCVGIETLFFNKNQKTAIGVAEARGVVLYVAERAGCAVKEFGPQEVKVAVTGYGGSDKKAVIDMVRRLVPNAPAGALDDEFDAIAVGITCLAHSRRE